MEVGVRGLLGQIAEGADRQAGVGNRPLVGGRWLLVVGQDKGKASNRRGRRDRGEFRG